MLKTKHPHSTRLIQPVKGYDVDSYAFNCHAFTLGIQTAPEFKNLRAKRGWQGAEGLPDGSFVAGLIGSLLQESLNAADGNFVLYSKENSITHSGIYCDGGVRSKWGTANTWEHPLFEIPSGYGCQVRYYKKVPANLLLKAVLAHYLP